MFTASICVLMIMLSQTIRKEIVVALLFAFIITGCRSKQDVAISSPATTIPQTATVLPTGSPITPTVKPTTSSRQPLAVSAYVFPIVIDPSKRYLFYLHGKIIEDQGIHAVDPVFGPYEYEAILEKLSQPGFVVVSEPRLKNTDSLEYAKKVTEQVKTLLKDGIPAQNITIAGASKGAGIAVLVSHLLEHKDVNFVLMSICQPDTVKALKQDQIFLYGNILSIYDSADNLAGSCQELFAFSEGKGIRRHNEAVLNVGMGHGILYKPLDEWVIPLIQWAGSSYQ